MAGLDLRVTQHTGGDLDALRIVGAARGWIVRRITDLSDGLRSDHILHATVDGLDLYYFECWPATFPMAKLTIWFTLAGGQIMVLGAYSPSLDGANRGAFGFALDRMRKIHGTLGTQVVVHRP